MSLTLSHQSALDVTRVLRSRRVSLNELASSTLSHPSPWVGKYWGRRSFTADTWQWAVPTHVRPVHVLSPGTAKRIRSSFVRAHTVWHDLPPRSILWLDEHSSMVCPELLFLQMAETLSFPMLVMLGYELCGHYVRNPEDPLCGEVVDNLPAASNTEEIARYLSSFRRVPGLAEARRALSYVCDYAMSPPESVLATMYSLPPSESGYGMGPVVLNERVCVDTPPNARDRKVRYPDIMFGFASVGINYDGADHLDLEGLVAVAQRAALAEAESLENTQAIVREKKSEVRAKVIDDGVRNRQLAAQGRIVFPATKEDLFEAGGLDRLTSQLLSCAHHVMRLDVTEYLKIISNTDLARDRQDLLDSLLPRGSVSGTSYGRM